MFANNAWPFVLAIADSGIASPTKVAVGDVRRAWQAEPDRFERLFDRIGEVTQKARQAIAAGEESALGMLMNENMQLARAVVEAMAKYKREDLKPTDWATYLARRPASIGA